MILKTIIERVKENTLYLVIGGSASGKNYYVNKHLNNIDLVDLDEITLKLANGNVEDTRKYVSKGIVIANKMLLDHYKSNKSVVQVTVGGGLQAVVNKLKLAKSYGFRTELIYLESNLEVALKRNIERAKLKKQSLIPDWKVEKTIERSKETYEKIIKKEYADILDKYTKIKVWFIN